MTTTEFKSIQRFSTDNSLSSLQAAYNMSSTLNCKKVEGDPVHWVQCPGVSAPLIVKWSRCIFGTYAYLKLYRSSLMV